MRVLNYIPGVAGVYTRLWMNEADFVFGNEESLVKVPYVDPSFWKVLMSSPWFQRLMAYEWIL